MIRRWWHRRAGHPSEHIVQGSTLTGVVVGWRCSQCGDFLGTATISYRGRTRPRMGWPGRAGSRV